MVADVSPDVVLKFGLLELGLVHVLPSLGVAHGLERHLRPAQEVGGHLRRHRLVIARQFRDRLDLLLRGDRDQDLFGLPAH
ncbi:hypothetical protein BN159_0465 [Streptomyces davaonensis JCM 4913]|uniref:Uncharacterized protein n=1 Tax=Streptomyces davaonensis (strain DSM 101723 / JCM 4913 / KCC S-0913 / 768) TaxID=1214101 RepID=K4QWV6_STRDJ|nr:hypothetical protein BN159_0465 [Streptomyces davaonensis JCM 4913]